MNPVVFSSASEEWTTPQAMYAALDAEFGFDLDAAATDANALCARWFTKDDDALARPWGGVVFLNPPYGHGIGRWVRKAHDEAQRGAVVVGLIPAKTETRWWHDYVMRAAEIRLVRGRMRFSGSTINAPFPSAVIVWRPGVHEPRFTTMDRQLDPGQCRRAA